MLSTPDLRGFLVAVLSLFFSFDATGAFDLFNKVLSRGNPPSVPPPRRLTSLVEKQMFESFEDDKDAFLLVETARIGKRPSQNLRNANARSHRLWDDAYCQLLGFLNKTEDKTQEGGLRRLLLDNNIRMEIAECDVTDPSSDLFRKIDGTPAEIYGEERARMLGRSDKETVSLVYPKYQYRDRWGVRGSMEFPCDASSIIDFVHAKSDLGRVAKTIASGRVVDDVWDRKTFLDRKGWCQQGLAPVGALHVQLPEDFLQNQRSLLETLEDLAARRNGVAIYVERILLEEGKSQTPNVYELKRYEEYKETNYHLPEKVEEAVVVLQRAYDRILGEEFKEIAEQARINATRGHPIQCTGFFGGQYQYILAYDKTFFAKSMHVQLISTHRSEARMLLSNLARKKKVNIMVEYCDESAHGEDAETALMLSSETGLARMIKPGDNFTEKVLEAYEEVRDSRMC